MKVEERKEVVRKTIESVMLKPCPFCGNTPKLFGKKIIEIDGETKKVMEERTEWAVVPFCRKACVLGHAFSAAYGIHGDGGYITPEAAIRAWNRRSVNVNV